MPVEARRPLRMLALSALALLMPLLAAVGVVLLVENYLTDPGAFNSDDLLCSTLCDDCLRGRDLREWHLPAAPYIFPDLPLLAPCHRFAPNIAIEFLLYCSVIHSCLLAVLFGLGRLSGLDWRRSLVAAGGGVALLAMVQVRKCAGGRGFLLVHPGSHVGAILSGLLLLTLAIRWVRRGPSWIAGLLLVLAGGFGAFSDKLLVAQLLAPTMLALLILTACRVIPVRRAGWPSLLLATSLPLAAAIKFGFQHFGFQLLQLDPATPRLRFPELIFLLRTLYRGVEQEHLLCGLIILFFLANLLVIIRRFDIRSWGGDRGAVAIATLTFALSPFCTLGALWVLRMAHHPAVHRYTLNCWFFPCILLPLLLFWLPGRGARFARLAVQVGIVLLTVRTAAPILPKIEGRHFAQPYPPLAQELDRLARRRGPLRGLGGFWLARSTGYFTREQVIVNPLSGMCTPFFHASNPARFLSDAEDELRVPEYQFLLVRKGDVYAPPAGLLQLCFGTPMQRIAVGADEIWLYDSLRSVQFQRFLRARLAERLHEKRPYRGPMEPASLAHPKPNRTPSDSTDIISLDNNQSLEIRFAGSTVGRIIDIGADGDDRLELDFYRGEDHLGSLSVPQVLWPGTGYATTGIQARLLPLPLGLRDRPWDRILVRPQSGSDKARLAHLLVFSEDVPGIGEERPIELPERVRLEGEYLMPVGGDSPFQDQADPAASGGRARLASVPYSTPFAFTPALTLPPGRYRLECALKVQDNSLSQEAARILVQSFAPPAMLADLPMYGTDFPGANGYAKRTASFEIVKGMERVFLCIACTGKTPIVLDYIDLIAEPPDCSSGNE